MNFEEILKPLEDLYSYTKIDWNLNISHILTEPVCPTISIRPDYTNITRYTAHCDPHEVEETLIRLVEVIKQEIIEGKVVGRGNAPFTNSGDAILEKWLEDRKSNKDLPFPVEELTKEEMDKEKARHEALKEEAGEDWGLFIDGSKIT